MSFEFRTLVKIIYGERPGNDMNHAKIFVTVPRFFRRFAAIFTLAALSHQCVIAAETATGSWRLMTDLTAWERQRIDLRDSTPRDSNTSYLPAEAFPFEAPYTAEEMGYRLMDFSHMARWSHVIADAFGIITKAGYLTQGVTVGMVDQLKEPGVQGHLSTAPGDIHSRQLYFYTYPPKNSGLQEIWAMRRTDLENPTKIDYFVYSPNLRRVRRQPPPRRESQFPDSVQSFDDIAGREAWEFNWRLIGADTLYDTVRFPTTRKSITLAEPNGKFYESDTQTLRIMGERYPFYTQEKGVNTFVVVAEPNRQWLPDYKISKLIYWVDQYYFYPIRIEQYDENGELKTIQVRMAQLENRHLPEGQGYANRITVYYDVQQDLISYSLHDAHMVHDWQADEGALFTPDFMRRRWLKYPLQSQSLIDKPEEFYLRPRLLEGRFPQERPLSIKTAVRKRIAAQEKVGRLVFDIPD